MEFCEFFFTKKKILRFILSSYLDGFSLEEIMWRLDTQKIHMSMDEIDKILDHLINCNY
jgi:hypothetical protein